MHLSQKVRVYHFSHFLWASFDNLLIWILFAIDSCIDDWFKVNRSCPEHPNDWRMLICVSRWKHKFSVKLTKQYTTCVLMCIMIILCWSEECSVHFRIYWKALRMPWMSGHWKQNELVWFVELMNCSHDNSWIWPIAFALQNPLILCFV